MSPRGPQTKNNCAGEDQQQSTAMLCYTHSLTGTRNMCRTVLGNRDTWGGSIKFLYYFRALRYQKVWGTGNGNVILYIPNVRKYNIQDLTARLVIFGFVATCSNISEKPATSIFRVEVNWTCGQDIRQKVSLTVPVHRSHWSGPIHSLFSLPLIQWSLSLWYTCMTLRDIPK
jgi:hypothetical protein